MKPIRLVLSDQGKLPAWMFGHSSAARWLATVCLIGALASLASVARQIWDTRQQLRSARAELAALQARKGESERRAASADRPAVGAQQSREWNQVVRQLNTPWPAVLDALETTTPDNVALVAIEPDTRHGTVRVQAEAKTLDTLLGYVETLRSATSFSEVVLIKHETNDQDVTRPVRLSVQARLKSPVPIRPAGVRNPE